MIIAIDPGFSGGIAWWFSNGMVDVIKMPNTPRDIKDSLEWMKNRRSSSETVFCYMEKAGDYMPGNSGPAAAKFARHCGHIEMALIALDIPSDPSVLPSKWQAYFIGKPNYPKIPKEIQGKARKQILAKRKTERKNKIKARAQALYPHLKITLATSDALGILTWGMAQ